MIKRKLDCQTAKLLLNRTPPPGDSNEEISNQEHFFQGPSRPSKLKKMNLPCLECDDVMFQNDHDLLSHVRTMHPDRREQLSYIYRKCLWCGLNFGEENLTDLRMHVAEKACLGVGRNQEEDSDVDNNSVVVEAILFHEPETRIQLKTKKLKVKKQSVEIRPGIPKINPQNIYEKLLICPSPCGRTHSSPKITLDCIRPRDMDLCYLCTAVIKGDTHSVWLHNRRAGHFKDSIEGKVRCPFPNCEGLFNFRRGIKNHMIRSHFNAQKSQELKSKPSSKKSCSPLKRVKQVNQNGKKDHSLDTDTVKGLKPKKIKKAELTFSPPPQRKAAVTAFKRIHKQQKEYNSLKPSTVVKHSSSFEDRNRKITTTSKIKKNPKQVSSLKTTATPIKTAQIEKKSSCKSTKLTEELKTKNAPQSQSNNLKDGLNRTSKSEKVAAKFPVSNNQINNSTSKFSERPSKVPILSEIKNNSSHVHLSHLDTNVFNGSKLKDKIEVIDITNDDSNNSTSKTERNSKTFFEKCLRVEGVVQKKPSADVLPFLRTVKESSEGQKAYNPYDSCSSAERWKIYKCLFCYDMYFREEDLDEHILNKKCQSFERKTCHNCNVVFTRLSMIRFLVHYLECSRTATITALKKLSNDKLL